MDSPKISVVAIFHNMRREAPRTLFTLSAKYQDTHPNQYEVLAIDNASNQALDADEVRSFGKNFHYHFFNTDSKSPCGALNFGARLARGEWIVFMIDGARMLSPGILHGMNKAIPIAQDPFIYTASLHLGNKPQNLSITEGYNQDSEDRLLEQTNWRQNGYDLFNIATWAYSATGGYFSTINESNCFMLRKATYERIGGYDEGFESGGGGLANPDIFFRLMLSPNVVPILLLGEGTFHQVHGGIATNVRIEEHPMRTFELEHLRVRGTNYRAAERRPFIFGQMNDQCLRLVRRSTVIN